MKFKATFKTPDILYHILQSHNEESHDEIKNVLSQFLKYDELITVEFDTETNSASVVKVAKNGY